MSTITTTNRSFNLSIVVAVAVMLIAIVAFAVAQTVIHPKVASIPVTGGQDANSLFRQEERALYAAPVASSLGNSSFYEFRRGEWAANIKSNNTLADFRNGERTASQAPDLRDFANYQYRQGEWSGQ